MKNTMNESPTFQGGCNIALKVPPHQREETVRFYRDTLGLKPIESDFDQYPTIGFEFGPIRLWIDEHPTMSQAEMWLELITPDIPTAAAHLANAGVARCDAIEPLPDGYNGFWITNPASIIHLVSQPGE